MEKEKLKSIYSLAKYPTYEILMEGQLASAGAHQARLIEKFKKNKNYIRNQFFALKIVFSFLFGFLPLMPLASYFQTVDYLRQGAFTLNTIIFVSSFLFGIYFGIMILYMLLFGMVSTSSFMSGNAFKWFQTLPFSKKDLKKIGFMTLFRNLDLPIIVLTFAFPLFMLFGTLNVLIFLVSLLVSFVNVVFSFSFLVIVGEKMSFLFSESKGKSKKANKVRMLTMLGYFIIAFGTGFVIQWSYGAIDTFFEIFSTSGPSDTVVILLSLIPFLLAPGYLITLSTVPNQVPLALLFSTLAGFALFILLTWAVFRKARGALRSAVSTEIKMEKVEEKKPIIIEVKPISPIKAFLKKDLVSSTRDIQSFMFIFFPIFYPLIMVLTLQGPIIGEITSLEGIIMLWSIIVGVYLFIPPMLVAGFLNIEESGASTVASLPVIPREQVKAKILLMIAIQGISLVLLSIILTFILNSIMVIVLLLMTLPIAWTFILFMLEMKITLFGKMKYKYIIEELNKEHKIPKWILMILSEAVLYFILILAGSLLISFFGITVAIILLSIIGIISLSGMLYIFTKMFPKGEKMSKYETGGLLRNKPILGGVTLTILYIIFLFLAGLTFELVFLSVLNAMILNYFILYLFLNFFFQFGFLALFLLLIVPKGMKLPDLTFSFKDYAERIHLSTFKPIMRNILIGVGSFIIFSIVVLIGAITLGHYVFDPRILFGNPDPTGVGFGGLGWFLFVVMLIPGIWEEVAYRGVVIPMLEKKYRIRTSLIISSIIFGFAHTFNIVSYLLIGVDFINALISVSFQVIYATLLGLAFGYMYIKTRALLPSIILHFLIDSVGQILFNTYINDIFLAGIFLILFLGLIPAILIILLVKMVVKAKPRRQDFLENYEISSS